MKWILALTVVMGLSGCATNYGQPLDPQVMTQVVEGKTTRAELLEKFGPPMSVTKDSEGVELLIWTHVFAGLGGIYKQDSFSAWINGEGIVSRYMISTLNPQ